MAKLFYREHWSNLDHYSLIGGGICLLFGSAFQFSFLTSKPCFSLKSVALNSFYAKANPQWIIQLLVLSLPIDVTSWSKVNDAESKTGQVQLLTYHQWAVKPESELTPKWCKIDLKYSFKLIFLQTNLWIYSFSFQCGLFHACFAVSKFAIWRANIASSLDALEAISGNNVVALLTPAAAVALLLVKFAPEARPIRHCLPLSSLVSRCVLLC